MPLDFACPFPTCTGTCTIDSMPHQLSTTVQIANPSRSQHMGTEPLRCVHACLRAAGSQPASAPHRGATTASGQASHPVVQDNQSCKGQASSGLDRATCPASGVARRRAPQLLSTYKNSRKAKCIATCSTRLHYDNNNTTSRNQNTTIPEDGNILETFRR